ncbi:histidinol-phosphate transaminase [Aliiruegeria lutimaris]|uniref:Histidinol-phosphate aminotransferase n=1 Tax=Aliiruegeria lutimaris TaxID=571298 RepID=A0A1G8PQR4_9RHOB|nr:histidinol-phosphate transaminase [Aliiruegeria lutimaris]SDI94773.1 histidinol phosphate aminotransferase apoenzyme [Aliiruegeria lutimaris]
MTQITPQPGIMDIALYQSGESHVEGVRDILKLSANENPFGPSPKAKEAIAAAIAEVHRYPNTDHAPLRAAIGEVHGLDPERIICGVGSDEILQFLCQAYAGPGDEVLYTEHGFAMYRILGLAAGATPVEAPERERVTDVDALLAACTERTKLVFIANPNNPTGTMIGGNELSRLADGLPEGAILVLDGAYAEFVDGYDGGVSLVDSRDNVFMTRTFSKLYGLGGLRVGWGYGPKQIIEVLSRIRQPFNLSEIQMSGAIAAVRDRDWANRCTRENARMRVWLSEQLAALGIPCDTSLANFVLARFADQSEAEAVDLHLKSQGVIVRRVAGYGLPQCLRITVGDEAGCQRVIDGIRTYQEGRK